MPAFDDLLNQILSGNPKIGRDELLTMVERKKEESHGLLSDEGAIRLLAQQLSASPPASSDLKDQRISSVHAGLNDSTITGEVISVSDVHRSEEHTSELQSPCNLVCRLLLEKKKNTRELRHPSDRKCSPPNSSAASRDFLRPGPRLHGHAALRYAPIGGVRSHRHRHSQPLSP